MKAYIFSMINMVLSLRRTKQAHIDYFTRYFIPGRKYSKIKKKPDRPVTKSNAGQILILWIWNDIHGWMYPTLIKKKLLLQKANGI